VDKHSPIETTQIVDPPDPEAPLPNDDIRFETKGAAAIVTLNRVAVLNALSDEMRAQMPDHLDKWARDPEIYGLIIRSNSDRAFSVGGDVRELYNHGRAGTAMASLEQEYKLNWRLDRFTKPTISMINGMVMGSGVGISQYGTHRVAGENYSFAMPEVSIGFFPDVGAGWFLSHLDDEIGTYLGLTGRSISRADAYGLHLASHCISSTDFSEITHAVANADPIDPVLDELHQDPGECEVLALRRIIRKCFSGQSVEKIIENIEKVDNEHAIWRDETLEAIEKNSPTSMKVTLHLLREGRKLDLRRALQLEYRLARRVLEDHDFYEGVRANLIDKDYKPCWRPDQLSLVSAEMIGLYFQPDDEAELELVVPYGENISND